MRKLINGKNATRFPLWNTIANHGAQYPISRFALVRDLHSYPYQALIRTWIPNILFLQRGRMQKLINGSMQNVSRSGEKGGPPAVGWWWKVESSMLG